MKYSVNNVGKFGIITDIEQTDLPPEGWTSALNIRCQHNWIGSIGGYESISPAGSPFTGIGHYIIPLQLGANYYIVYPCDTDSDYDAETIYQFDGSAHTEITRASGDYTGAKANRWNGCNFQNIAILNNGVDAPQYWAGTGSCANMIYDGSTDWEAQSYKAKVIRSFTNFVFALNITEGATNYPQMLHWSDAAEPGTMPTTWDYASTTNLSGRLNVDAQGGLLDALSLRSSCILYAEDSASICNYVGGNSIFDIDVLFIDRGIYTTGCAIDIGGRHVVLGDSSLYVHDGHSYNDILSGKDAERLFNDIDPSLYEATFLAHNRAKTEVWVCYPSIGAGDSDQCNRALIWNYQTNAFSPVELPNIYYAITGIVASSDTDFWNSESTMTWDAESEMVWANQTYSPIGDTFISISTDLWEHDSGNLADGSSIGVFLEKTGIDFGGTDDLHMVTAVYPRIEGGPVSIQIGRHTTVDSPVTWESAQAFTPGTTRKLDFRTTDYYSAIRFSSSADTEWKLNGYDIHYEYAGRR